MNINSLSQKYSVRKLDENDVDIIYDMSCKNDIFINIIRPLSQGKVFQMIWEPYHRERAMMINSMFGFFENDSLVGLMDLILDYPEKEISFIGLFMTDTRYQNRGVGSGIISDVILCLKSSGYKEIRLGVDKGNPQSYSFWIKNKFTPIREDTYILMGLRI